MLESKKLIESSSRLDDDEDITALFAQAKLMAGSQERDEVQVQKLLDFFSVPIKYLEAWNALFDAMKLIIITTKEVLTIKNLKYVRDKDNRQSSYIAKAMNMIRLSGEYVKVLDNINLIMNPALSKHITISTPEGGELMVIKGIANVDKIFELRKLLASNMHSVLFSLENRLIESRLIMFMHPTQKSIHSYLEFNRDLMKAQLEVLKRVNVSSLPKLTIWTVLNKNLGRVQSTTKPVSGEVLTFQKLGDLKVYDDSLTSELLPFIPFFNEAVTARTRIQKGQGVADDYLAKMVEFLKVDVVKQNALLKLIVLATAINCYVAKNNLTIEIYPKSKPILKDGIKEQIEHLEDFVNNLGAVRLIWNSKLFKVINNIIYIKSNIADIICISEQLLLYCEVVFRHADKDNSKLKDKIIEWQIKLIGIQNTMLTFIQEMCEEQYVKYFYLKNESEKCFVLYNATAKNIEKADNGDFQNIINGIPIKDIKERNELRKFALEGIILESEAGHRKPEDKDYFHALSGTELEEYLKQWAKEAAQEKASEEDKPKPKTKHQKRHERDQRLAKVKAEKADAEKRKNQSEKSKPNEAVPTRALALRDDDELTSTMDGLLLKLDPKLYSLKVVSNVIVELNKLILASTIQELVFKALSAIGDTYSMIGGSDLNHSNKNPEKVVVDLKLALNYYSRAELVLKRLDSITPDQHSHYYTWLVHSISMQQKLLDKYVVKFARKSAELEASKERYKAKQPEKWYSNHERENWKESSKTVQGRAYKNALEAANVLQDNCRVFATRVDAKAPLKVDHQAYGFEHYLSQTGKRALSEPTSYQLEDQSVSDGVEIAAVSAEQVSEGVFDVVRMPQTQNALVPATGLQSNEVTFTRLINFNAADHSMPFGVALDQSVPPFSHVQVRPYVPKLLCITCVVSDQSPAIDSGVSVNPSAFQRLVNLTKAEVEVQI